MKNSVDHPWSSVKRRAPQKSSRVWLRMTGRYPIITIRVGRTRSYRRFIVLRVGQVSEFK